MSKYIFITYPAVLLENKMGVTDETHHASGPAVHHLCQAKLKLSHELLCRLRYPTIPLQLADTFGHRQHSLNSLKQKRTTWDFKSGTHLFPQDARGPLSSNVSTKPPRVITNLCFSIKHSDVTGRSDHTKTLIREEDESSDVFFLWGNHVSRQIYHTVRQSESAAEQDLQTMKH